MKAGATFISLGQRQVQEDHILLKEDRGIMSIADGFGGATAGVEISRLANDSIYHFMGRQSQDEEATMPFSLRKHLTWDANLLNNAVLYANRELLKWNQKRPQQSKGGAAVIVARVKDKNLSVSSVGNASSYLIRGAELKSLTQPRSVGLFEDPFLGWANPNSQIPLSALGVDEWLDPDTVEFAVQDGDWVVLHSDGVWPDLIEELAELQKRRFSISESVKRFEQICKLTSFNDNASISLAIL